MRIYKICTRELWEQTLKTGLFPGMPIDIKDGYIHFSTAEQQRETARKHFAGQKDLIVLSVDSESFGDALRFEPSSSNRRPGSFPHLYGPLPLSAILAATPFDAAA